MTPLARIQTITGFDIDSLDVDTTGVSYLKGGLSSKKRHFAFSEIEYVLLSPGGLLAFQVGDEVFSIQTKPNDTNDRQAVETFVTEVRRSVSWGSFRPWRE